MNKISLILPLVISFFSASPSYSQAFGIEQGASLDSLVVLSEGENGNYTIEVPKPHPEFEFYTAKLTPETGVCMVRGIGRDHENDRFGNSIRKSFNELKNVLSNNYGNSYTGEYLLEGALWDDSNEWVMSIRQNERVHQAVWDQEEQSNLPDGMSEIILSVNALSSDSSWVALQYRFDNHGACSALITENSTGGL